MNLFIRSLIYFMTMLILLKYIIYVKNSLYFFSIRSKLKDQHFMIKQYLK